MRHFILLFSLLFLIPTLGLSQDSSGAPSPIIFIYDASGSMWGQMQGKTKMEIAADVLSTSVNKLPDNQNIGLVAYGHRKKGDCTDVEFLVDVENGTKSTVNNSIKGIKPLGKTPLAYSATQVINRLRESKKRATIILVTDGIESCNGNLCDVVKAAKKEGIDFKLHIIGFGLKDGETDQLECAAEAGDGNYYDAADADGLGEVLDEATNTTVDDPKGNFSVYTIKNGESIDAHVRAFDVVTNETVDVKRTYRDTTYLYLPPGTYNLLATPLEGSDVNSVTVSGIVKVEDKSGHQTISFDGGKIEVFTSNNGEGWDSTANMFSSQTGKKVAGTRTYGKSQIMEVNPGVYDVEFGALVIEGLERKHRIENVVVNSGETTRIEHNFETGIAMIGAKDSNGLVDATVNFYEINSNTNVAGSRTYTSASNNPRKFLLNPGTYKVVMIPVSGPNKGKKETFIVTVKQGETVEMIKSF